MKRNKLHFIAARVKPRVLQVRSTFGAANASAFCTKQPYGGKGPASAPAGANPRRGRLLLIPLLVCLLMLGACGRVAPPDQADQPEEKQEEQLPENGPEIQPEPEPQTVEPARATLVAAGDNLLHNTISWDAQQADGSYYFKPVYQYIKGLVEAADLAFLNQEVPLSGAVGRYPSLDAPQEAADAVVDCGFDIVNEATNHALDKGVGGLMTTLEGWRSRGIPVTGAYLSEEDAQTPRLLEKNGIVFGFLGYTYGTNGIPVPEDKSFCIAQIDQEKLRAEITALRPQCDYLVVSMHWGTEYRLTPTDEQRQLAQLIADCGADLIIGHHPHVLEPAEWLTGAQGNQVFCIYSLGNFVSSQNDKETMLGGLLSLTVVRDEDGTIRTEASGILPVITHFENGGKNYRIYPLEDYTQDLIAKHAVRKYDSPVTLEYYNGLADQVLGEFKQTKETFACHP